MTPPPHDELEAKSIPRSQVEAKSEPQDPPLQLNTEVVSGTLGRPDPPKGVELAPDVISMAHVLYELLLQGPNSEELATLLKRHVVSDWKGKGFISVALAAHNGAIGFRHHKRRKTSSLHLDDLFSIRPGHVSILNHLQLPT